MQIELTPEQDEFVQRAIDMGRIARPEDAVAEALARWTEAERERAELIASLDEADAEYQRGEYITLATEEDRRAFFQGVMEVSLHQIT